PTLLALPLPDALPISVQRGEDRPFGDAYRVPVEVGDGVDDVVDLAGDIDEPAFGGAGEYERAVGVGGDIRAEGLFEGIRASGVEDRKSTRLNSSHVSI